MQAAIDETDRRRAIQVAYNEEHGITPASIVKGVSDIAEFLQAEGKTPKGKRRSERKRRRDLAPNELEKAIVELEEEMLAAAEELRFEYAARLRDELRDLRREARRGARSRAGDRARLSTPRPAPPATAGRLGCAADERRSDKTPQDEPQARIDALAREADALEGDVRAAVGAAARRAGRLRGPSRSSARPGRGGHEPGADVDGARLRRSTWCCAGSRGTRPGLARRAVPGCRRGPPADEVSKASRVRYVPSAGAVRLRARLRRSEEGHAVHRQTSIAIASAVAALATTAIAIAATPKEGQWTSAPASERRVPGQGLVARCPPGSGAKRDHCSENFKCNTRTSS